MTNPWQYEFGFVGPKKQMEIRKKGLVDNHPEIETTSMGTIVDETVSELWCEK